MSVRYDIIKEVSEWVQENVRAKGYYLYRFQIKDIAEVIYHERVHERIYEKFGIKSESLLELDSIYIDGILNFACNGKCICYWPYSYNDLKYYPKVVFIEFIQAIYEVFYQIALFIVGPRFTLKRLKRSIQNSFDSIKNFLKTLLEFRVCEVS